MSPVTKAFCVRCCLAAALLGLLVSAGWPRVSAAAAAAPSAATPPARAPLSQLTSILVVAQDVVSDPNFAGSIVVVMNNLGPAPIGIIINRPMPVSVSHFFPTLKRLAHVHDKVYYGGPVEFGTVWYLFRAKSAPAHAIRVCDGVYVSASHRLLLKLLARRKPMEGLRVFLGHAGWAPGQLQAEIEGGAWSPRRADAASIFAPRPLRPWPSRGTPKGGT